MKTAVMLRELVVSVALALVASVSAVQACWRAARRGP